jgi:hypothetical protein
MLPNQLIIVALITSCGAIVAALLAAAAAIMAQVVSQRETTRRETAARSLREQRVRSLFVARLKALLIHFSFIAEMKRFRRSYIAASISKIEEVLDALSREFAIFELSLALEAEAIEAMGLLLAPMQNLILEAKKLIEMEPAEPDGHDEEFVQIADVGRFTINSMLKALKEPPDDTVSGALA